MVDTNVARLEPSVQACEVEAQVLACLLLSDNHANYCFDRITPDHFQVEFHRVFFGNLAAANAEGKTITNQVIRDSLPEKTQDDAQYVNKIMDWAIEPNALPQLVDELSTEKVRLDVIDGATRIAHMLNSVGASETNVDGILSTVHQEMEKFASTKSERGGLKPLKGMLDEFLQSLNDESLLIDTGIRAVDQILFGLRPGNLCVLAGGTSMGKTAFAMSWAAHLIKQDTHVAYFGMEMSRVEAMQRFVSMGTGISITKLRKSSEMSEHEQQSAVDFAAKITDKRFYFNDTLFGGLATLARQLRRQKMRGQLDVAFVDHLGLIPMPNKSRSRYEGVTEITRQLKQLACDLNIPIVLLCQLNRNNSVRKDKYPILADLRDSGSIEQDADQVIMIHRSSKAAQNSGANEAVSDYDRMCPMEPGTEVADIFVHKNRHGPTAKAQAKWIADRALYANL